MSDIVISTDGTIENTKLMVDGKELTKKAKVVSIDFVAAAPFKGKYSGEVYSGGVSVSYSHVDEEGKIKRESYGKTDMNYVAGVGQKIKSEDQVIRFIADTADAEASIIAENILDHCEANNIPCPDLDTLLNRSIDSLRDKADDLGLEDADKYYAVKASETSGDQPKYPINNCSDVSDAWKLRSHGKGLKISQEQLESRIKRRARQLGCPVPGDNNDSIENSDAGKGKSIHTPGKTTKKGTKTGVTSSNNGHNHNYTVDSDGNGQAHQQGNQSTDPKSSTPRKVAHMHVISNWKVESTNNHTHNISRGM